MLKIKVGTLRDPVFHESMRKLYASDKLPGVKIAHHVKKMVVACDELTGTANDKYQELCNKHCERDDEGNPVLAENNHPKSRTIKKDEIDVFNASVVEMNKEEVDLDIRALDVSLLSKVQLAPANLHALEPVLDWSNFDD